MAVAADLEVRGLVVDGSRHPVGGAEVLVRAGAHEASAETGPDGRFLVRVPRPEPLETLAVDVRKHRGETTLRALRGLAVGAGGLTRPIVLFRPRVYEAVAAADGSTTWRRLAVVWPEEANRWYVAFDESGPKTLWLDCAAGTRPVLEAVEVPAAGRVLPKMRLERGSRLALELSGSPRSPMNWATASLIPVTTETRCPPDKLEPGRTLAARGTRSRASRPARC